MMHHEFEALTGWEVTLEDYNAIIEPMYMATDMSKQEFVKVLDRKRFDQKYIKAQYEKKLVKEMRELAAKMKDLCGHTTTYEIYEELRKKALEYISNFPQIGTSHDFETAKGYSNCTYVTTLVYYDKNWNEVKRIDLIA